MSKIDGGVSRLRCKLDKAVGAVEEIARIVGSCQSNCTRDEFYDAIDCIKEENDIVEDYLDSLSICDEADRNVTLKVGDPVWYCPSDGIAFAGVYIGEGGSEYCSSVLMSRQYYSAKWPSEKDRFRIAEFRYLSTESLHRRELKCEVDDVYNGRKDE